jgi:hypothetical protein
MCVAVRSDEIFDHRPRPSFALREHTDHAPRCVASPIRRTDASRATASGMKNWENLAVA